jgi:hypothetical protein
MSFMDNIGKLAGNLLGGASPQAAATAASEHVGSMDSGELAGHLTQSLGGMDRSQLVGLGQQLLQSLSNHPAVGSADAATQAAGTTTEAVAAGEPGAIGALLNLAKQHQDVIQSAASSFFQQHPSAISNLAPGLLQGILGRLGS